VNAEEAAAVAAAISAATALVSVGALVVSTWLQWRAGRPRVEVEGAIHTLVSSVSGMGKPMFGIDIRNVGVIPVVVTSVGIVFHGGELGTLAYVRTLLGEQVLPKKLGGRRGGLTGPRAAAGRRLASREGHRGGMGAECSGPGLQRQEHGATEHLRREREGSRRTLSDLPVL
jgi:hypothetical protein